MSTTDDQEALLGIRLVPYTTAPISSLTDGEVSEMAATNVAAIRGLGCLEREIRATQAALAVDMQRRGWSVAKIARELGITRVTAYAWLDAAKRLEARDGR